jgi:hypothetical protein
MTRLVLAAAVAIALCACGVYRFAPTPSPNPQNSPPAGFDVVVTEQDQAATVQVGQTLLVELHAKSGMTNWSGVKSSDTLVLASLLIDVMVPKGVTMAGFKAVSPGEVTVGAYAGPLCSPGQACPAFVIAYSLRVTVLPG